jgi:hypothetical protein
LGTSHRARLDRLARRVADHAVVSVCP